MYAFVIKNYERKRKKPKKYILHDLTFIENIKNSEKYFFIFYLHHGLNKKFIKPMKNLT